MSATKHLGASTLRRLHSLGQGVQYIARLATQTDGAKSRYLTLIQVDLDERAAALTHLHGEIGCRRDRGRGPGHDHTIAVLHSAPALFQHVARDRLPEGHRIIFEDAMTLQATWR